MKTLLVLGSSLLLATSLTAQAVAPAATAPAEKPRLTKEQIQERIMKHTGGRLVRPGTKQGEVVYVNCQTRAGKELLEESKAYFEDCSKFNISIQEGSFTFPNPTIKGNASLFIIDDETMPPILLAPESRWAMINVAPLAKGYGEQPAFFNARVKKELTRGFAMLCGATNSGYPQALTGGIVETKMLDKHVDARLPVDVIARFAPYMEPFGVTPAVMTTYRKACQEGWAPAPTNDFQKAIFEQIKAEKAETLKGPKNPRRITFDPQKGE